MLHSFVTFFPKASVYAYDVSCHNRQLFNGIAKKFWTNFAEIHEKFDFISMIYCLEHIFDVKKEILRVKELLNDDGILMVQVPNIRENLWDIFVYDHIHHFSIEAFCYLFEGLGFSVVIPKCQIDRGITLIAKKDHHHFLTSRNVFNYPCSRLKHHFQCLDTMIENKEKVAVFGSALNSTFIGAYLGESLEVFLDEDRRKVGKEHLHKKIILPSIYKGKVIMPYSGSIAKKIKEKYHFSDVIEIF